MVASTRELAWLQVHTCCAWFSRPPITRRRAVACRPAFLFFDRCGWSRATSSTALPLPACAFTARTIVYAGTPLIASPFAPAAACGIRGKQYSAAYACASRGSLSLLSLLPKVNLFCVQFNAFLEAVNVILKKATYIPKNGSRET